MKTALATDEPDEPERKQALTLIANTLSAAAGAAGTGIVRYTFNTAAAQPWQWQQPTTEATFPQRVIGPWQCPDCQTWMAPTVTEHRCA